MVKEDFIKILNVCGKEVHLGLDDYGQCFYIEYEEDGKPTTMGLGTYCTDYMESIYSMFDPLYNKLMLKYDFGDGLLTEEEKDKLKEYEKLFEKEYRS